MNCPNCGSIVADTDRFCSKCGGELPIPTPKKKKKKRPVIIGVLAFFGALFVISSIKTAHDNKPENKFKKTAKEFAELIDEECYEEAEELLEMPDSVWGSFADFAKENLQGAKLEKSENGYKLSGSKEVYELISNDIGDKILSDDFLMEYKAKCSSYLSDETKPSRYCEYEVLEDGMTIYTIKAYKSQHVYFSCGIYLGNDTNVFDTVTFEAAVDENYKVTEIEDAYWSLGSSAYDKSSVYVMDDGTIVVDRYEVREDFAENVACIFSGYGTALSNSVLQNLSYDVFYSRNSGYIFNTDYGKAEYEAMLANRDYYMRQVTYVEYFATRWEYPTEFRYSSGEYILKETVKITRYKDGKEKSSDSYEHYVLFKPGEKGFKVFSYSDNKENLYNVSEIGDDTNAVEDIVDASAEQTIMDGGGELDDMLRNEVLPAYEEYIQSNGLNEDEGMYEYSLIYLNDDDIPELVVSYADIGNVWSEYYVLIYENEEVYQTVITASELYYKEKANSFYCCTALWDDDGYTRLFMDSLEELVDFETVVTHNGENRVYTDGAETYLLDGIECSEEEYRSYFDTSDMEVIGANAYSTINEAFNALGIQ